MTGGYKILEWDSDFFGYKVAKISKNFISEKNYVGFMQALKDSGVEFAEYTSEVELSSEITDNPYYLLKLVVSRVPIIKKMENIYNFHKNIELYDKDYPEKELIELAQLAGRLGRFGNDENIPAEKYYELFKNWIINSVNKKLATDVLVYRVNGKIIGFITIKVDGKKGSAPLLAVNIDYEGIGVSFALMRAAETVLVKHGCTSVLGGTQDLNQKTLKITERYGFKFQKIEYVYHLWNKK